MREERESGGVESKRNRKTRGGKEREKETETEGSEEEMNRGNERKR